MSLEEIKNLKLKKVQTKIGRGGMKQLVSTTQEQTKLMDKVSFHKYYPYIESYTFKSTKFEISDLEIDTLISEGEKVLKDYSYRKWEENKILIGLGEKIMKSMKELKTDTGFVRFNTLSPKDGIFSDYIRLGKLFQQAMMKVNNKVKELQEKEKIKLDFQTEFNKKIYALYIASTRGMMVLEKLDGIRLLVHSKRTLHELVKFKSGEIKSRPHMIVRQFAEFDVQYEFRGFVYDKKFVCLSQYNPYCFFPEVLVRKKEIEEKVRKFLDSEILQNKYMLELENFILDLVLVGEEVKVVELNPYGEFAGSCLFDWSVDEDFKILTGKGNFEFRILEGCPPLVKHRLEKNWVRILDNYEVNENQD